MNGVEQDFPAKHDLGFNSISSSSSSMGDLDWLELPCDVLSVIIDKVISSSSLSDYIRFGAVCSKWRCVCLDNYEHIKLSNRTPILLKDNLTSSSSRNHQHSNPNPNECFYSLTERKGYSFKLPVPFYMNCHGSNFGWIVTQNKLFQQKKTQNKDFSVRLLNPFKSVNNEIQLPGSVNYINKLDPSSVGICMDIRKAVLSTSPSSNPNDFTLMVIFDNYTMGFYKSGDKFWNFFERQVIQGCEDVVYFKGHFVAFADQGLVVFDPSTLHSDEPKVIMITKNPPVRRDYSGRTCHFVYLVESSGDLLMVYRYYPGAVDFKVYKLVELTKWVEVNTLDGRILFLSRNCSMSASASDLPGYKPNCIYFAGLQNVSPSPCFDRSLGGHHMGVFNLEDKSFEPCYVMKSRDSMMAFSWILPTL